MDAICGRKKIKKGKQKKDENKKKLPNHSVGESLASTWIENRRVTKNKGVNTGQTIKQKKGSGSNNLVCSKCGISRSREYFNHNEREKGDGDRQCRTCLNSSMQLDALTKKRLVNEAEAKKRLENEDDGGTCPYCVGLPACTVWCPSKYS